MFLEEKKMFWEEAKPGKDEYQFIPSSQLQVCFHSQDNKHTAEAKVIGWNSFVYSVKNHFFPSLRVYPQIYAMIILDMSKFETGIKNYFLNLENRILMILKKLINW